MADFKALATKMVTQGTFAVYQKTLDMAIVEGATESGTAIDLTNTFEVNGDEDTMYYLVTNVDQWSTEPTAGNIDLVFDGVPLKITKVDKDAAEAAYFITAKTYVRKPIVIQQLSEVSDGAGGYENTWATFASVDAEVTYSNANESFDRHRVEVGQSITFYFRYVADLDETMRVSFNGEFLDISSINNIHAADEWVEIVCERNRDR